MKSLLLGLFGLAVAVKLGLIQVNVSTDGVVSIKVNLLSFLDDSGTIKPRGGSSGSTGA